MNRYIRTLAQIMAGLTVLVIIVAVTVSDDNGLGEAGGILLCVLGGILAFQSYAVVLAIDIWARKASVRAVGKILVIVTAVAFLVLVYETTSQSDKQTPMIAGTLIGAVISQPILQRLPWTKSDLLPREIKTEHLHIYTDLEPDSARFYADFFEGFTIYFKENYFDFCQEGARAPSRETKTGLLGKILALFGLTRKRTTQRTLPPPDRLLDVYLFRNRLRYEFYSVRERGPATRHGYYSPHENLIVVNLASGLGTATHELVHHFVARGFAQAQCPQWVDEGFAMFFEKFLAHFDEQGKLTISLGYFSNWRFPQTKRRIKKIAFDDIVNFRYDSPVRSFMLFLHRKGWLKDFIQQMIIRRDDPTGEITLQQVCGKDISTIVAEWKAWVRLHPIDRNVRLVKRAFIKTHQDWETWWNANHKKMRWNEHLQVYEAK